MGETGPDERIYVATAGAAHRRDRNEPFELNEMKLRAKMRDGFACVRCGAGVNLQVHHTKGTASRSLKRLQTLCRTCHQAEHGQRQQTQPNG
jgi:5-methylcytosine-specific restriction endonuclease McrA